MFSTSFRRHYQLVLVYALIAAFVAFIGVRFTPQIAVFAFFGANLVALGIMAAPSFGAVLTMLDIAKLTGNDETVGLIEENVKKAPEVGLFPFRTIKGTSYKTGIRTGLPTVGFRSANEGHTPSKSSFVQKLIEAFIFGGVIKCDKAVADADEKGAAHVQSVESSGVMEASLRGLGSQIWYGITNDAKGFPGLKAFLAFGTTTAAGDALTINATGTTASTASSVYAVKFGEKDVTLIGGNDKAWELGDFKEQLVPSDADATKFLMAYVAGLTAWIGLQIGHENVARRICNLTADSGKGLTDSLLADLLATFPVGMRPDAIFVSRRSCTQLQKSRTVTLQGQGTNRPDQPTIAPRPTSYEGIPIIETDSILNTDAIEV